MIRLPILREWLRPYKTLLKEIPQSCPELSGEIYLSDPAHLPGEFHAGAIVLLDGTRPDFRGFFTKQGSVPFFTVICSPEKDPGETLRLLPENYPGAAAASSVFEVYNRLAEKSYDFREWLRKLDECIYKSRDLQSLLDIAHEKISGTCTLIDSGFKLQAAFYAEGVTEPAVLELREKGYCSYESIQQTVDQPVLVQDSLHFEFISRECGNYTILYFIRYQGQLAARLCLHLAGPDPDPYSGELLFILYDKVSRYLFSRKGLEYHSNTALGSLVADLIECRLTDQDELAARLTQVQLAVQKYYHVMLVSFDTDMRHNLPWNYIMSQLQYVFPYSSITTYKGDILVIIRKKRRGSRIRFDEEKLLSVLEKHHGTAAMGNAAEHLTTLPTVYHQVKAALRIGHRMDPGKKILFYEDYAVYQIIEFAEVGNRETTGSTNLVHLCNNEIVALLMYDEKNGTDMVGLLHEYLRSERNASQTAKALFLHRNTIIYKIRQIEEILDTSLDDPVLRERLLFGCSVLNYMKKYRNEDILKLNKSVSPAKVKDGYKN